MKKFFLPLLLLLLSIMGLTQSAEKLRSLTQSDTVWEDYQSARKFLYQTLGNLFSTANTVEKPIAEDTATKDAEPNPIIYVSSHLSNSIVISVTPSPSLGISETFTFYNIKPWLNLIQDGLTPQQTDRGPDPAAGFRIFMEIVERCSKTVFMF
jgi:hypothetical protein